MNPQGSFAPEIPILESGKMSVEEFLKNDVEGYEYVKGEFVPMPPAAILHGKISVSVIRHLDLHVYQHQLGYVYTAETSFRVGRTFVEAGRCVRFNSARA